MEKLPPELLTKILLYLPLEDRLSCSLTCRRWADAMSSYKLLDDVWLDIAGREMEEARSVLVNTKRRYTKLVLYEAGLFEFDSEFWRKIGENLRVLELKKCSWSTPVFYAILRQCTKLESLKIVDDYSRKISMKDFILPEDACHEELFYSLSHLRHLHLDIELSAEILDFLLGLMPNVTSIFMSLRFEEDSDFLERLPSILEKNQILRTAAFIRMVNESNEEVIKFVKITSGSLEELRIVIGKVPQRFFLTKRACDAIVSCTKLRHFTVNQYCLSFDASHLKKLVSNSPNLETLEFYSTHRIFEDEDIVPLIGLKNLRSLALRTLPGSRITKEFLCRLGEISTLVKLHLEGIDVDSRVIRSLGFLTNLRSLVLTRVAIDSECFGAICENFERLTELNLGSVENLTDADGIKLCRFKQLRSLTLYDGRGFTDLTFERGVGSRAMKYLSIHYCPLTDAGLASIASHHNRLETLILGSCENITDDGLLALLRNEPRLKGLLLKRFKSMRHEWFTVMRNLCRRTRFYSLQIQPVLRNRD